MIKKLINRMIEILGKKNYQIDLHVDSYSLLIISFDKFIQYLRGFYFRFFIRKSSGFLLIGRNTRLRHCHKLTLGSTVLIEDNVRIDALTKFGINIGNNVTIKANTIIDSGLIQDIGEGLNIGNHVGISQNCFIQASGMVTIGNNVIIGPGSAIFSENHKHNNINEPINMQGVVRRGVYISDGVWIGSGVKILDGVNIGESCIVAAGAVVTKSMPAFSIIGGIPAKVIRSRLYDPSLQNN